MGCFNETCFLSGLPILHGDKVCALPLVKNPNRSLEASPVSYFHPSPLFIYGKYDEYGTIEKVEETNVAYVISEVRKALDADEDDRDSLTIDRLLKQMATSNAKLITPRTFTAALGGQIDPHLLLHRAFIRQDVFDQVLASHYRSLYVSAGLPYKKVNYESLLEGIDDLYTKWVDYLSVDDENEKIRRMFRPLGILDNPTERTYDVGHYLYTYFEFERGMFFGNSFREYIIDIVEKNDYNTFKNTMVEFSKGAILRMFVNDTRKHYYVPTCWTQERDTEAQELLSKITISVAKEMNNNYDY